MLGVNGRPVVGRCHGLRDRRGLGGDVCVGPRVAGQHAEGRIAPGGRQGRGLRVGIQRKRLCAGGGADKRVGKKLRGGRSAREVGPGLVKYRARAVVGGGRGND